ncbi:MAG: hypothetical protein AB7V45_07650 [Candidatus Krumholzibacteriia bacterium]
MSAIMAVLDVAGRGDARQQLDAVLERVIPENRGFHREEALPQGLMATVGEESDPHRSRPAADLFKAADGLVAACYGSVYDLHPLYRKMGLDAPEDAAGCPARALAEAYRRWGADFVHQVTGEYSFLLFDPVEDVFLAGRDPLGTRPLFYYDHGGLIGIATDSACLLSLGGRIPEPDPVSVFRFLCMVEPVSDRTFFLRVFKVRPGHLLRVGRDGKVSLHRYFQPGGRGMSPARNVEERREEFRTLLSAAVERRYCPVNDVELCPEMAGQPTPISGMVTALRRREGRTAVVDPRWSLGKDPKSYASLLDNLRELSTFQTGPVGELAGLLTWLRLRDPSPEGSSICLSNVGLREFVDNWAFTFRHFHLPGKVASLFRDLGRQDGDGDRRPAGAVGRALKSRLSSRAGKTRRHVIHGTRFPWISSTLARLTVDREREFDADYASSTHRHLAEGYLLNPVPRNLQFIDGNGRQLGVEFRFPFLDVDLLEFCFGLPADQIAELAFWLSSEMSSSLELVSTSPVSQQARSANRNFWEAPELHGFLEDILGSLTLVEDGWLRREHLLKLHRDIAAGNRELRPFLWRVIALESWYAHQWSPSTTARPAPVLRIHPGNLKQSG